MLAITIKAIGDDAELLIDYQDGVGFCVLADGKQYDFDLDEGDWETIKVFIDSQAPNTACTGRREERPPPVTLMPLAPNRQGAKGGKPERTQTR